MEPEIIFADDGVIVLNKPPGLPVHGGGSVAGATLIDFLLAKFPEIAVVGDDPNVRPGIVHRLDKDTSGVMLVARTQERFLELKKLFQARAIRKTYLAIVCGRPKNREGVIDVPIGRNIRNPTKRAIDHGRGDVSGARDALTEYRTLRFGEKFSLVEFHPKTGRMHQLRIHAQSLGTPIACDKKYGGARVCCPVGCSRQLLHAQSISFSLSPGNVQSFAADPPDDFSLALKEIV